MEFFRISGLIFIRLTILFVTITILSLIETEYFPNTFLPSQSMVPLLMVFVCFILYRVDSKKGWELGWKDKHAAGNFLLGAVLAIIIVSITSTIILASSSIEVIRGTWDVFNIVTQILIIFFATVGNELLYRGYLFNSIYAVSNMNTAVVVNSIVFSLVYILVVNSYSIQPIPYESLAIGLLNLFLLSLLLNQAKIYTGSLWMPIGLHFLFNVTQSTVFGYLYGGNQSESIFTVIYTSHSILNGGTLGIQASILSTPILIIAILIGTGLLSQKAHTPY